MKPSRTKNNSPPVGRWIPAGPLSPRRLWLFRFILLLFPFAVLGLLELALRLGGYGYDPRFFKRLTIGAEDCFVQNEEFSRRFFPRQVARHPGPVRFPAHKSPGTFRIFVLGESAAMGDPAQSFAPDRYMEILLREKYPGVRFEVINVAFTAINSHVILPIARECAEHEGDLWIIYMGNNEMVGPFGAATVFGWQAPPLPLARLSLALQRLRLGQWLVEQGRKLRSPAPAAAAWGGMEMFLNHTVAPDSSRKEIVYRNFQKNLHDILRAGIRSGAKVLLNTVAVNLKDSPPFASTNSSRLSLPDRAQFDLLYTNALVTVASKEWAKATAFFEQAGRLDARSAELEFHWAEALLAQSNWAGAAQHFQLACDNDALPFRADSRINAAIRVARENIASNSLFVFDAAAALAGPRELQRPGASRSGPEVREPVAKPSRGPPLPPSPPSDRGESRGENPASRSRALPQGTFAAVSPPSPPSDRGESRGENPASRSRALPQGTFAAVSPPSPPSDGGEGRGEEAASLVAYGGSALSARSPGLSRPGSASNNAPGIPGQETFFEHVHFDFDGRYRLGRAWAEQVALLLTRNTNAFVSQEVCEQMLGLSPWNRAQVIHFMDERMLMPPLSGQANNVPRREALAARINELRTQMSAGNAAATRQRFLKMIEQRPEDYFLSQEYAVFLELTGDPPGAAAQWQRYRDLVPQDSLGYYQAGRMLNAQQRYAEAEASLRIAVAMRPGRTDAWTELGNALALQKNYPEALACYSTALEQEPRNPQILFRRGKLFARLNQHAEAKEGYRAAIRLNPAEGLYHHELGAELAATGESAAAGKEFGEAARLNPDRAAARFDYGAWLLDQKRWDEAQHEFDAVVRLEPGNLRARQNLEWLQAGRRHGP